MAAITASSRSWRSSLRASRSPVSGSAGEHVVAVDEPGPREDAVVESEQADHPVGHRAHRHHRADGEGAGAEVGAGGPARRAGRRAGRARRPAGSSVPPRSAVARRPRRARARAAGAARRRRPVTSVEVADPGAQRVHPLGHGAAPRRRPSRQRSSRSTQLGEPAGQVDLVAADVVERQAGAEVAVVVAAHRDAEEDAVEAGAPGVLGEPVHRERRPRCSPSRPHRTPALGDPAAGALEVVVGEPEPPPARLGRRRGRAPRTP